MKAQVISTDHQSKIGNVSGETINSQMKLKLENGELLTWYNTENKYPFEFNKGDIISGLKIREISGSNTINYRASKLVKHQGTLKIKGFFNEFQHIRNWANEKGILEKGDVKTQYVKLQEEAGELAKSIFDEDQEEFKDAIGDMVVVLTSLAHLGGFKIEDCINSAYDVIAKRTGKMVNGSFIKDK